jgi:hypothetical protein
MLRDQNKIPCGYFWWKTDSRGKKYLAGVVSMGINGEIPVVIFEEENKPNDAAPDFVMRNAVNERKNDTSTGPR